MSDQVGSVLAFCKRCTHFRKNCCVLSDNDCLVTFKSGIVYDVPSRFKPLEVLG